MGLWGLSVAEKPVLILHFRGKGGANVKVQTLTIKSGPRYSVNNPAYLHKGVNYK